MNNLLKRRSIMITIALMGVLMVCLGSPLSANEKDIPGTKTILVIGAATTGSADASKVRDLAISNGLVSAVTQATDELLPENGLVKYFPEISQTLLINTTPFITAYQVPAESTAGNLYRVVIKVTISMDALKKHLQESGFIRAQKSLPKILILISEKSVEDTTSRFWWDTPNEVPGPIYSEQAITDILTGLAYEVLPHDNISFSDDFILVRQESLLSNHEALKIGRNTDAEILIVGDAQVELAPNVMGSEKRTFKGIVSVRAIKCDSGEQIAQIREEASALDTDPMTGSQEALTQAGHLVGKALSLELASLWQAASVSISQIYLKVEGISDLSSFVKFRKALKKLPGVNSIFVSEMKADEAGIQVEYDGSTDELAEALMLVGFESFGINIYDIMADEMKIKLVREASAAPAQTSP